MHGCGIQQHILSLEVARMEKHYFGASTLVMIQVDAPNYGY